MILSDNDVYLLPNRFAGSVSCSIGNGEGTTLWNYNWLCLQSLSMASIEVFFPMLVTQKLQE